MLAAFLKEDLEESGTTITREEMATIPILRQYSNRRTRKSEDDSGGGTLAQNEKKDEGKSLYTVLKRTQMKDSNITPADTSKRKPIQNFSASPSQVIVRKFTLPTPHSSVPMKESSLEFQKPKQRWKQLCNLTQEMTTTLPVSKMKMYAPTLAMTREFAPVLPMNRVYQHVRNSTKIDIKALQKVLANKKLEGETDVQGSLKTIKTLAQSSTTDTTRVSHSSPHMVCVSSTSDTIPSTSMALKPNTSSFTVRASPSSSPSIIQTGRSPSVIVSASKFRQFDPSLGEEDTFFYTSSTNEIAESFEANAEMIIVDDTGGMFDAVHDVPEVAAMAEITSDGEIVRFDPKHANFGGIIGGKLVLFQKFAENNTAVQEKTTSNTKTVEKSVQEKAATKTKEIDKLVQEKAATNTKEIEKLLQEKAATNAKVIEKVATNTKEIEKLLKEKAKVAKKSSESSLKNKAVQEKAAANTEVVERLPESSLKMKEKDSCDKKSANKNVEEEKSTEKVESKNSKEKMKQAVEKNNVCEKISFKKNFFPDKEVTGSLLKATLLGSDIAKEQNVGKVRPMIPEVNNKLVASGSVLDTIKSSQKESEHKEKTNEIKEKTANDTLKQTEVVEKVSDVSVDSAKKALAMKQMHDLALLKARQTIALQVEREVLRAKEVKVVREVNIRAHKALLSDAGTQTNLFSLVEPGRMVEMMINSNKPSEIPGTGVPKGKLSPGESSGLASNTVPKSPVEAPGKRTGVGMKMPSENMSKTLDKDSNSDEPDKKRPRLDESAASGTSYVRTSASDTMSVDSGIDVSGGDLHSSLMAKNINLISLNTKLAEKNKGQLPTLLKANAGKYYQIKAAKSNSDDNSKTVFDIIVQHNIATQSSKTLYKVTPTETETSKGINSSIESDSANSRKSKKFKNATSTAQNNNRESPANPVKNMNIQQTVNRINELKYQVFQDWSQCLIADIDGNIPLHKAVQNENVILVRRQCAVLCARKASLDIHNNDKRTPLHLAVIYGNAALVRILMSFGAQPSVKDRQGNTALHLAILEGNLECASALLNTNSKTPLPLDELNDEGYAPMHLAALRGKVEETELLIAKGADINLKDARSGRTALFHAVEANDRKFVRLLLESDASTNEPNFAGHTPLSAASEISFNRTNENFSEGMNFSSKLVPLKSGNSLSQILEDGNIEIRGEILEGLNIEDISDDDVAAHCYASRSRSKNSLWASND